MKSKRIIAFLTVIALLIPTLASCGKVDRRMKKAKEHFDSNPYAVNITLDFTCDDPTVSGIFTELEKNKTTVYFDSVNFKSVKEETIDTGDGVYTFNTTHTYVNGTVFRETSYSKDGMPTLPAKNFSFIETNEDKTALLNYVCLIGGISADGFATVGEATADGKNATVLYSDPNDSVKEVLRKMLVYLFEGSLERATVKSASLRVSVEDNMYKSAAVECVYDVTIDGKIYTVGATVRLDFSSSYSYRVYSPADTSTYSPIDIKEILPE